MPIQQERMMNLIREGYEHRDYIEKMRKGLKEFLFDGRLEPEVVVNACREWLDQHPVPVHHWLFIEREHFEKQGKRNEGRRLHAAMFRQMQPEEKRGQVNFKSPKGVKREVISDYGPSPEDVAADFGTTKATVEATVILGEDGKPVSKEQLEEWRKRDEETMKDYKPRGA